MESEAGPSSYPYQSQARCSLVGIPVHRYPRVFATNRFADGLGLYIPLFYITRIQVM